MTKDDILKLVDSTENPLIKAGEKHRFNYIWIVVVDGRMFCRQYDLSEKSWYATFLQNPKGYVKCNDTIIKVNGIIPKDLDDINDRINNSYLEKHAKRFTKQSNYAYEIIETSRMEKTMELIPILNK